MKASLVQRRHAILCLLRKRYVHGIKDAKAVFENDIFLDSSFSFFLDYNYKITKELMRAFSPQSVVLLDFHHYMFYFLRDLGFLRHPCLKIRSIHTEAPSNFVTEKSYFLLL